MPNESTATSEIIQEATPPPGRIFVLNLEEFTGEIKIPF